MNSEKVLILDFGSQYTQLIARRVRENNVYCEIIPFNADYELTEDIKAIILSGSPMSVRSEKPLIPDFEKFMGKVPVLAICYGAQLIAHMNGGVVEASQSREFGKAILTVIRDDEIFSEIDSSSQVWMSHGDSIKELPNDFLVLANTASIPVAAYKLDKYEDAPIYCFQFHPEVTHSIDGGKIMYNFLIKIAGFKGEWTPAAFIEDSIKEIQETVGEDKVLMAISGGVDSSVAAMLVHRAIGDQLTSIFVDNGLLRKGEYEQVLDTYERLGLNVMGVEASEEFYENLEGHSEPEKKRKIIGNTFIDVFDREAHKITNVVWLAQGTIYPDVIESVSVSGPSMTIKSHHNVGGLPEKMHLKVIEPLKYLFKDEVRKVGEELQLPYEILGRHPFPGPGLGIRILGEVTTDRVKILQEADDIYISLLKEHQLYDDVWQAGTILLPVQSVGVMGDERTYEFTIALRAVNSVDGMTAEWSRLPHDFLAEVSSKIINRVKGINRVVYDISTKPPATIEWE